MAQESKSDGHQMDQKKKIKIAEQLAIGRAIRGLTLAEWPVRSAVQPQVIWWFATRFPADQPTFNSQPTIEPATRPFSSLIFLGFFAQLWGTTRAIEWQHLEA